AARRWLEKEPPRLITTWDDLVSKFINEFFPPSRTTNLRNEISNFQQKFDKSFHEAWERYKDLLRACPHHSFTELHQLDTFYNALNPADQDSLNAAAGGNLLEKGPQDALTIIENKSKVRNSRSKPIASLVNACDTHSSSELAKLTHAVNQQTSACLAVGGNTFPEYRDNTQGYVSAAAGNFNQDNPEKIKRMNDVSLKAMQNQIDMVKNKLINEMKASIQTSLSNQTNEIKNMMASLFQMNIASTSGSGTLPGNNIANPKGKLKAITTRSGLVTEGPTVPNPPKFVNPEEDECVKETYTDPDHAEYTIKVPPPPPVQKPKPPIQRNFVSHTRDSLPSHIPYPSQMLKQKQQEKDDIQIQKFWNMFKQLHLNITLAEALVLMPKYLKMLKALLSNKEKLQELANTPLNENCSAVILKKLPEKLRDPGKFLIPCGFSLPDLIPTRMTLELANRAICTPDGIARDFFVPVGRPFLRTARALIDVHDEEMILHYDDNRACDIESDIREIEFLLFQVKDSDFKDSIDQSVLTNHDDLFVDPTPEMFIDEQPPDYSFPPRFDVYPDDFLEIESDATFDDDLFDSKGEKIKEAELLLDSLNLPCDILSEYDSFNSQDFSRDDVLFSPDNEDKVFNPGILSREKSVLIITRFTQEKKLAVSFASWLFEDFDPPFYELLVFKEVPNSMRLLPFSSENEEKVLKLGIYTFKKFHCCFLSELSHP
nr:hypothetical protein [Tanacetum cinerariifolium]